MDDVHNGFHEPQPRLSVFPLEAAESFDCQDPQGYLSSSSNATLPISASAHFAELHHKDLSTSSCSCVRWHVPGGTG